MRRVVGCVARPEAVERRDEGARHAGPDRDCLGEMRREEVAAALAVQPPRDWLRAEAIPVRLDHGRDGAARMPRAEQPPVRGHGVEIHFQHGRVLHLHSSP